MRCCPVDGNELLERALGGVRVDACEQCGGLFFDQGELAQVLGLEAFVQDLLALNEPDIDAVPDVERARQVRCPADGADMQPHEMAGTIVDRCPACDGAWLDSGELCALKLAEANIKDNLSLYLRLGN